MNYENRIIDVQQNLLKLKLDGWLLYDFRRSNNLACQFLEIPENQFLSRRFFYWIPSVGTPIKIVHSIENHALDHLPGKKNQYHTWQGLEKCLKSILSNQTHIAMEYSPKGAIPAVSKVDGGTIDLVKSFGVEIQSSGDLLQKYTSVWDEHKLQTHLKAAQVLCEVVDNCWLMIGKNLRNSKKITEYDVQEYILEQFEKNNCLTSDAPICAVNAHSADPHYCPNKTNASIIQKGDFILIDLWCKQKIDHAVYADITRVGVAAETPTQRQQEIFEIVRKSRDAGTKLVMDRFKTGILLKGYEVDQCCRDVIGAAGYGEFFIHRTGHNIDETDHGNGAHLDNLETHDDRQLLPGTCFSIEPGIYLPNEFGVRLEYDVYVSPDGIVQVTGGIQESIKCLL
jgi:Xaa-Pro dipeptidase